jgi:hypothetical protein
MSIFAKNVLCMKVKKFTVDTVYAKMIEEELKNNNVVSDDTLYIYFNSYYIGKFLNTNLSIKAYLGLKMKEQLKDVFVITIPFEALSDKEKKKYFKKMFEEGIRENDRYIGLLKTESHIGFILKHDEELLNAFKTGQYSKISETKKSKMKRFRILDYDMKVQSFYIYGNEENEDDWKEFPMGKSDLVNYELKKLIHPEYFYNVMAEQFNVKVEYLKKNNVQILPKPNLDKLYFELSDKDTLYWFEKK